MFNTDGDELVFAISYPLKPEASANAIRLALAAIPALRAPARHFRRATFCESAGAEFGDTENGRT